MNRRLWVSGVVAGVALAAAGRRVVAADLPVLEVAYAGSMGSMMEGPIKSESATALGVTMHGSALGSDALAGLIIGGTMNPDVFISVTPGPILRVLKAGKAKNAIPVARTEMVISYAKSGRFAQQFADAAAGKSGAMPWWEILQQPDLRFGRTDPVTDPQGRNIIFTLQLAETYYKQPGLAKKVLGETINPAQIFSEPTVQARLQGGQLDAASAYKIQPQPLNLPYIGLPDEINLGSDAMRERYASTSLELKGKTYHPEPLVYFAAALTAAPNPAKAAAFVDWLAHGAQPIFRHAYYDPPTGASPLHA
jgi:molybdate/tungstate transport system substrate-binding protein